ncbi:hypothetical protein BDU57DRAFT_518714 [Ampelomyces quisqualis]|uniref:Carbonic anhydrase n=1 Tax=Ampelomyces quisqualis TaxID=50730 RepID=A0A6A5QLB7_AMPQU|nr:hypothetical protein BDU57DRAFT_518714 [Ampelomyces quisqualis]
MYTSCDFCLAISNVLLLLVTCMDARIDPTAAFGIPLGAAHVIRNAGASACDAFRSIVISLYVASSEVRRSPRARAR